jgi:hypothetical protein
VVYSDFKQKTLKCVGTHSKAHGHDALNNQFQMPATAPLEFEGSASAPLAGETTKETSYPLGTGNAFNLRYDKLVIAVGAYSQSTWTVS